MTFQEELTSLKNRIEAIEAQTENGYVVVSKFHEVEIGSDGVARAYIKTDKPYVFSKEEAIKVKAEFVAWYNYQGKKTQIKWKVVNVQKYRLSRIAELRYVYSVFEKAIEAKQ